MLETESEAWTAVADTLEMLESLPPLMTGETPILGLCFAADQMYQDGAIAGSIHGGMRRRIKNELIRRFGARYYVSDVWLAKPGAWRVRVDIARRFARQAEREGR